MKKIRLHLSKTLVIDSKLVSKLHGFLMGIIANDYASILHQQETNPYSMNVISNPDETIWTVNLLTETAEKEILPKLVSLEKINLKNVTSVIFVKSLTVDTLSSEILLENTHIMEDSQSIYLKFYTPTTFKSQGKYSLFPDTRLIFQSLMQKYTRLVEQKDEIEEETLTLLTNHSFISSYHLKSHYFPIHKQKIPAFQGGITIKLDGSEEIRNYANRLLKFGEYAGIGTKCSLGMGGVKLEERKKR